VRGCKSEYAGHSPTPSDAQITFHSFPMDCMIREKWICANSRRDSVLSKHLECVLSTFETVTSWRSIATTIQRGAKTCLAASWHVDIWRRMQFQEFSQTCHPTWVLLVLRLAHQRLQRRQPVVDSRKAGDWWCWSKASQLKTPSSRWTTQQLKERLEGESTLPGGFYLALIDRMLIIYRLVLINSVEPCIHGSVTVRPDLTVVTRVDGREVPSDEYKNLLPAALQTMSQLLNLMARI